MDDPITDHRRTRPHSRNPSEHEKWQDIYQLLIKEWIHQDKQKLPRYAENSLRTGFTIARNMKDIKKLNRPLSRERRIHNLAQDIATSANNWTLAHESVGRVPGTATQYDQLVRHILASQPQL